MKEKKLSTLYRENKQKKDIILYIWQKKKKMSYYLELWML